MLAGVMSRGAAGGFMGRRFPEQPGPSNNRAGRAPVKPEVEDKSPLASSTSGGVRILYKPTKPCESEFISKIVVF